VLRVCYPQDGCQARARQAPQRSRPRSLTQRTRVEATLLRSASCCLAAMHGAAAQLRPVTTGHCLCTSLIVATAACLQVLQDEGSQALVSSSAKRPTGRVVGVIRRNWRTRGYAGKHLDRSLTHASMHHILHAEMRRISSPLQSVMLLSYTTSSVFAGAAPQGVAAACRQLAARQARCIRQQHRIRSVCPRGAQVPNDPRADAPGQCTSSPAPELVPVQHKVDVSAAPAVLPRSES
jgi:hypothetical protein